MKKKGNNVIPGKRPFYYASKGLNPRVIHSFPSSRPASICLLSEVMHCFFTIRTHSRISSASTANATIMHVLPPMSRYANTQWYIIKCKACLVDYTHRTMDTDKRGYTIFEFMLIRSFSQSLLYKTRKKA